MQTILQGKIVKQFRQQLQNEVDTENQLLKNENALYALGDAALYIPEKGKNSQNSNQNNNQKLAFVPDHLGWGCVEGVWIFKNTSNASMVKNTDLFAESFVAIRDPAQQFRLPPFNPDFNQAVKKEFFSFFLQKDLIFQQTLQTKNTDLMDVIYIDAPKQKWEHLSGYTIFKNQNQSRVSQCFVLANTSKSVVYQLDVYTGKILKSFQFPVCFKQGFFVSSDVFYGNAWHTCLAAILSDKESGKSAIYIFEVNKTLSETPNTLTPIMQINNTLYPNLADNISCASLIRFNDGQLGIAIGGSFKGGSKNRGILQIFSLQTLNLPIQIELELNPIIYLQVVDLETQGVGNRIYCSDKTHWWAVDLNNLNSHCIDKLASFDEICLNVPNSLVVVKAFSSVFHQMGVNLYFLAKDKRGEGLFRVFDPLKSSSSSQSSTSSISTQSFFCLAGNYQSLYARFGRLALVPKQATADPVVFNLANEKVIKTSWQTENNSGAGEVCMSLLLWDPKQKKDILYTMNQFAKIFKLMAAFNNDKYGRLAWRLNW